MKFVWKQKYKLLLVIIFLFVFSIYKLIDPQVFYDSERILQYADDIKIEKEENINSGNLFLVGVEFDQKIQLDDLKNLQSIHDDLLKNKNVVLSQNIFNDISLFNFNLFLPVLSNRKIETKKDFDFFLNILDKKESLFISKDLKKLFFIVEIKTGLSENSNRKFINEIQTQFNQLNNATVYITGQIKGELYIKEKVIQELKYMTFFSALLCCLILWFFSRNIRFVSVVILSVLISVMISFMISQVLFGGIELVMIIMPAILFIVCISDFMHLVNDDTESKVKQFDYFKRQINTIGKPVALTSITTAIGFLSFCFSNVLPITRLGIITTIGIVVSLFVILVTYAVCIDLNLHKIKRGKLIHSKIDSLIEWVINFQYNFKSFYVILFMLLLCFFGVYKFEINNHIYDEFNKSSSLFKEMKFFDQNFGGYKQVSFNFSKKDNLELDSIVKFEEKIEKLGFTIDKSLFGSFKDVQNLNTLDNKQLSIKTRMPDIGSKKSLELFEKVERISKELKIDLKLSGNGYLFDKLSDKITLEILYGLLMAILTICSLFLFLSRFNLRYLLIVLVPNTFPILVCIGIMSFTNFYFSLSNAFIFAIIFGLIVDDSIHIITSHRFHMKNGLDSKKAIDKSLKITGRAVIKTTLIIIVTLIPLLFSEFSSIGQLGMLTIISAIIAVIFDLIYLPRMIRVLIRK